MKPQAPVTAADCQALHAELLRLGARGVRFACPRVVLARTFGGDRRLRHIMAAAPTYGVPIASSNAGYFAIERPEDAEACVADLRSRIAELGRRAGAIEAIGRTLAVGERRLF
jgi:hypothetical protein